MTATLAIALLRADGVAKSFGDEPAVASIDLDLVAGEIHALVGLNGAGKTTLMRLLLRSARPQPCGGGTGPRWSDGRGNRPRLPYRWRRCAHRWRRCAQNAAIRTPRSARGAAFCRRWVRAARGQPYRSGIRSSSSTNGSRA